MKTVAKNKLYEGMFLVDSAEAGTDWDGIIATIRKILEKAKAEIVAIRKWDDRRLAYGIRGKVRGTYILCYFRADGQEIQDIEKAVQLSEKIMRVLILSAEQLTPEDIEKDTPAAKVEKEKEQRKVPEEQAQDVEAEQPSDQQEAEKAEEAEKAAVAEPVAESEKAEEIEKTAVAEPVAESEQAEETEKAAVAEPAAEAEQAEEAKQVHEEAEDSPESKLPVEEDD